MRRGPAALLLTLVLAATSALASTTAAAGPSRAPAPMAAEIDITPPTLEWGECAFYDAPAECATAELPLDYDDPTGPTTPITVLRVPARGDRIGTLFVNPGGPGASATGFAAEAGRLIGPGVSRRFDVVGIDPRGVGFSGAAWCRVSNDAWSGFGYPVTRPETRRRIRADRLTNAGCAERRSVIIDHMSSADVARDMDVIRQALGEEQVSYYGVSYGSLLGQTYAAMFPDRVRAMIVDGVLDPVEWTSGHDPGLPMTYRLRSGRGSYEAITSVLNECDRVGRARCVLAGHANETWRRLVRAARTGELRVGRDRVTVQDLVNNALSALYSADSIRYLIDYLAHAARRDDTPARTGATDGADRAWAELERIRAEREAVGPFGIDRAAAPLATTLGAQRGTHRAYLAFESVVCGDAVNPHRPFRWAGTSRLADRTQPWFGRLWTWYSSVCARWEGRSGQDAFRGPWATVTSYPLLVVGNAYDPATPISGARAANRLFAGSVLLMLNGWGHGALGNGDCIRNRMAAYLIDRTLPAPSTVCQAAVRPFPG
ncbi:alpha/beta hydrolase [Nocardioides immobilis]|uniref:Alpha/beta hydrolase n=1 Tax=Nocardioides immobilis TaxID=2049295 RepID=A0A417Y4G0_9ACTN|nr:alpha/beta hydrolase [Nocardioides immobilis]RHW27394.1 alpha/beta hydrolase [Nocardioides immobilis]